MLQPKMGGKSNLRILLKGGEDVNNSLLSLAEGGKKLARGLRDYRKLNQKKTGTVNLAHLTPTKISI